jgi:plastocyanin
MSRRWVTSLTTVAIVGAAALAGAPAPDVGGGLGPDPAAAALCTPVGHSKRVVKRKRVIRHGHKRTRKVVRIRRWTTCEPIPLLPPEPTPPDRLQVKARDTTMWTFLLSRPDVTAGDVTVELVNEGEDDHNLHMQQGGTGPEYYIPDLPSLQRATATFNLTPGTWHLWCNLPGHEAAGMSANLQVN